MVHALSEFGIWLIVLCVFGFLVLVHEVGHFLIARRMGVRILRFSIGFGPKIVGWCRGDTEYWLSWVPLGGYVKMAGEQRTDQPPQPGDYQEKSVGKRAIIVAAGPAVNYLVAWIVLWVFFMIGYPGVLPVVGEVTDGMPAQEAGLLTGDRILAIDARAVRTWDQMTAIIRKSPERAIQLRLKRNGRVLMLPIVPISEPVTGTKATVKTIGLIGIGAGSYRAGPVEALGLSITTICDWTIQTLTSLVALVTRQMSMRETVTGPIGILHLTSEAARVGLGPLLYLTSLFSLSLAIFNVFPIPILDGGHLLFLAIEKLRGKPVSPTVQERAAMVSLAVLVSFVLMVSINDLQRLLHR